MRSIAVGMDAGLRNCFVKHFMSPLITRSGTGIPNVFQCRAYTQNVRGAGYGTKILKHQCASEGDNSWILWLTLASQ